jgi:NitT/TauT family transport system permease protein
MTGPLPPSASGKTRRFLSVWDLIAVLLVLGALVVLAQASRGLVLPLQDLAQRPVTLDPANLPGYAARTSLRMLAAMGLSLLFTFTYATWAAKSRRAGAILIPLLDILQSVPILGFISVTVVFFMSLAPGRVLGAEFAAVFAIFTSQAWNMAFSFYQSLRTVPEELSEASRSFRLGPWMRFWRLDVPFAMPSLVWNMMMSMSGGWFFVVASEAISVGNTTVTLPGIGSYIALAIEQRDLGAVGWAIGVMLVVILIYDQLLFRPLVAWADRFRFEQETGVAPPRSWVLMTLRRSRLVAMATAPFGAACRGTRQPQTCRPLARSHLVRDRRGDRPVCPVAHRPLPVGGRDAVGCGNGGAFGMRHDDPGVRADCHRQCHLDSGRRVDRAAPRRGPHRAARHSVHGGLPGQPVLSRRRLGHRGLPP